MRKNIFTFSLIILSILIPSSSSLVYAYSSEMDFDKYSFISETSKETKTDEISTQQLKGQIYFFQQALNKLGASSPEQAAELWAQGPKTRNGVFQYSVSCDNLKASIIKKLGKPEESFWNIGVSSPWVEKYEISKMKKLNALEYETTIKYYWTTSTGSAGNTQETLIIRKNGNVWCVKDVK